MGVLEASAVAACGGAMHHVIGGEKYRPLDYVLQFSPMDLVTPNLAVKLSQPPRSDAAQSPFNLRH